MLITLTLIPMLWHQDAEYLIVDGHLLGAKTQAGWARPRPESIPPVIQAASIEWSDPNSLPATFRFVGGPEAQYPLNGAFFSGKAWQPRLPVPSKDRSGALREARNFARNRGIAHPSVYLNEVLEIDLDGDGKTEQIISASSRPRLHLMPIQANDWSAVLLRWRGPVERIFPLTFSSFRSNQPLSLGYLRSMVDFDGDERIEIVTSSIGPSLKVMTLWTFVQGKLTPTIETTLES